MGNGSRATGPWEFEATKLDVDWRVAQVGDYIGLTAKVLNCGADVGSVYLRFLIASSYDLANPIFDSHKDLPPGSRQALKLVDIQPGKTVEAVCRWKLPALTAHKHFDIRVEVWNPHLLFAGPWLFQFHELGWNGGFHVVDRIPVVNKVFISYSWDSDGHKLWVRRLVEELRLHGIEPMLDQKDLRPGENIDDFMTRGIARSKAIVLMCTEKYTKKANSAKPSGVSAETIIASHRYNTLSRGRKSKFVAVIRDNSLPRNKCLPTYLASSLPIDMTQPNWQAAPMSQLVEAIRRHL
jgi:hypothetical protein